MISHYPKEILKSFTLDKEKEFILCELKKLKM